MTHTLKVVCIGAIFGTLLHPNGEPLKKEDGSRVGTYITFALCRGWQTGKELSDSGWVSSVSTTESNACHPARAP